MGAVEAVLRVGLVDLGIGPILREAVEALVCVEDVEGHEEGKATGHDQGRGADLVAADEVVDPAHEEEEDRPEGEGQAADLHVALPEVTCVAPDG